MERKATYATNGRGERVRIWVNDNPESLAYDAVLIEDPGNPNDPYMWPGEDTADGWDDKREYPEGAMCPRLWVECYKFYLESGSMTGINLIEALIEWGRK